MAILIGSGEPVSRARRGLDVKGKVNFGLDETIVPMAILSDFTGAPYRRSPVRWWVTASVTGVPGQFSAFRLSNTSGRDQLLDRMIVRAESDTRINVGSGQGQAPGVGAPARTTEIVAVPANATGDISREVPIELTSLTITPSTIFDILFQALVPTVAGLDLPLEIVLPATPRPDDPAQNVTTLTAEINNLDVNATVSFSGLYFDQLPLDLRT